MRASQRKASAAARDMGASSYTARQRAALDARVAGGPLTQEQQDLLAKHDASADRQAALMPMRLAWHKKPRAATRVVSDASRAALRAAKVALRERLQCLLPSEQLRRAWPTPNRRR